MNTNKKNIEQLQETDNNYIYKANVKGVLAGGSRITKHANGGMFDGLMLIVWAVTLPISLTIGAGIKTLVDINTRKKMTKSSLTETKHNIEELNGEKFDQFVDNVMKHKGNQKSNSSRQIFKAINAANVQLETNIKNFQLQEENEVKARQINNLNSYLENNLNHFKSEHEADGDHFTTSFSTSYTLTDNDQKEVNEKVKQATNAFAEEKRNTQKQAILSFMSDPKNAGKKTQHVIKESVENILNIKI